MLNNGAFEPPSGFHVAADVEVRILRQIRAAADTLLPAQSHKTNNA
jgi:hypothetical protein